MDTSHKKHNLFKQNLKNIHAQKRIDSLPIINLFIMLVILLVIRTPLQMVSEHSNLKDMEVRYG